MQSGAVPFLANLPLASMQRLVVKEHLCALVPQQAEPQTWHQLRAAATALAAFNGLEWNGQLNIDLPDTREHAADEETAAVRAAAGLQRLHQTIAALGPLAAKSVTTVQLYIIGPCTDLSSQTADLLATAFGANLQHLRILLEPDFILMRSFHFYVHLNLPDAETLQVELASLEPSFWAALAASRLPQLTSLEVQARALNEEHKLLASDATGPALQQLAASFGTRPLQLAIKSDIDFRSKLRVLRALVQGTTRADATPSLVTLQVLYWDSDGNEVEVGEEGESDDEEEESEEEGAEKSEKWVGQCERERVHEVGSCNDGSGGVMGEGKGVGGTKGRVVLQHQGT